MDEQLTHKPIPEMTKPTDMSRRCTHITQDITARKTRLSVMLDLSDTVQDPGEISGLTEWLLNHHDLFALDDTELSQTMLTDHTIHTGDHPPIRQLPRREAFAVRPVIRQMVQDMINKGIVQPSSSPCSPIVLVRKRTAHIGFVSTTEG